jgi:transposase
MARTTHEIALSRKDRNALEALAANGNTAQKIAKRARIVLLAADGLSVNAIMREAGVSKTSVWRWPQRFLDAGVEGLLKDKSKKPGKKPIADDIKRKVLETAVRQRPGHATHWSVRMLASAIGGISHTSVQRILREHGLKPHLTRTFKVSNDPAFAAKVKDIVGLYMNPPEKAIVLSVDEKSQIQALDRTQPGLPMKKGRAGTMTHDYKRHGTTTLFAALDVKTGEIIGECLPRHRAEEFIRFLAKINRITAKHLDVHLILDNYSTHKTEEVQAWLAKHPRFKMHFTPTSCSWLNLVERLFAEITRQRIRRGVFKSVDDLEIAITDWVEHRNANPKPFKWTAKPGTLIAKHRRATTALASLGGGCK